ncbi:hypothetical protein BH24ACI3_BH24ACI3_10200 [soil metagenome]
MKKFRNGLFRVSMSAAAIGLFVVAFLSISETGTEAGPQGETGTLEKMIVSKGTINMTINTRLLNGKAARSTKAAYKFDAEPNSFFTIFAFNDEFRGTLPSTMNLVPSEKSEVTSALAVSFETLMIESIPFGESDYEMGVRDSKTSFNYFDIEGQIVEYVPEGRQLTVHEGRLLISREFAERLGRPSFAGTIVGEIHIEATMQPIEITQVVNGDTVSTKLPPVGESAGTVPGPDVVVGDVYGLAQFGSAAGEYVGLAVGTNSCNYGTIDLNWFALPDNDHPVIPQNLYRMSGGPNNDERFEQIGQSSVKHAFTALTENLCGLGCNGVGGSRLGSGCSDPYSASMNAGPSLGSRAWIDPFTGFFPRGDSGTSPNSHSGHTHTGTSHRILTKIGDLSNTANVGAKYYAEAQYVTPHEYQWCLTNPTQCNLYNNVSYRQYTVNGSGSPFTFAAAGSTVREKAAIQAWPDSTSVEFAPAPGSDGVGIVAYKVSNPSPGIWRYEYAIYNQNIDRAIRSFSVPVNAGVTITEVGFYAPPQHPGSTFDGTVGNAGFSSQDWAQEQSGSALTWSAETFIQNPNANAIRWGTMYNFRFESNRPPTTGNATLGFLKTGEPITVPVQIPESSVPIFVTSVSGRVMTSSGTGVAGARVTITDSNTNSFTVITSSFGFYRFDAVVPGATYTVSATAKRYTFTPQQVEVNNQVSGLDFISN